MTTLLEIGKNVASQPRRQSALESIANVLVGFGVAILSNNIVLPLFGYQVSRTNSFYIALIFTAISLVRSYVLRRSFNWWHVRSIH